MLHVPYAGLLVGLFWLTSSDVTPGRREQEQLAVAPPAVKPKWSIEVFTTDPGIDARIECIETDASVHYHILVIDSDGNWREPRRVDPPPTAADHLRRLLRSGDATKH
jgi:hypothetical protein